jgi:ATP-dependent RNA helicase
MEKQLIQIGLEFVFGPLLKDEVDEIGNDSTGVKLVDDDIELQKLDKKISDIWCSLWTNDPEDSSGMRFDEEREKELAPQLLEMINQLIERLNEINDGSYEIEDMITDHLKSLIIN